MDLLSLLIGLNFGMDDREYDWKRYEPKDAISRDRWFEFQNQDVGEICAKVLGKTHNPFSNIQACVQRDANLDGEPILKFYYPINPPQWMRDHEERHADGWYHQNRLK